jgi:hypothetical protein
MKQRKPDVDRKEDTKRVPRKEQVAISRLRTALCPFCNTHLSVDHILWKCKENEDQTTIMDMKKEQCNNGKKKNGKDN